MKFRRSALAAIAVLSCTIAMFAQETVKESSTGKVFPAGVTISQDGKSYSLVLTGTAVRKKLIIKVYAIAHYMQDPPAGSAKDVCAGVLTDGKAKQITMQFVREVGVDKIRTAYRDGFQDNAGKDEYAAITPLVEQFVGYFGGDVKEGDTFILRWLPGGVVQAQVQGEEKPAISSPLFARVLWSIWLGEDAIVDREDLVSRCVK
jgi:hypothetical protein